MEDISETYSKKQLVQHMQAVATPEFLTAHKVSGAKCYEKMTKEAIVVIFRALEAETAAKPAGASGASPAAGAGAQQFNFSMPAVGDAAAPFSFNFNMPVGKGDDDEEDEDRPKGKGARGKGKGGASTAVVTQGISALAVGTVTAGSTADDNARVRALKALQVQQDEASDEFERKCRELEKELDEKTRPLAAKRRAIVNGTEAAEGAAAEPIEHFWLKAIENHTMLGGEVRAHDIPILQHLVDIELVNELDGGQEGFKLNFEFSANDYFTNTVLTKTYIMDEDDDDTLEDVRGCEIKWKPGKDVTVRTVTKKQKKKGKERVVTIDEPVDSFFSFFSPPSVPEEGADIDDDEAEELQNALEQDYAVACIYRDKLVPNAVNWYTGEAEESDDDEDDEYGGEDDDEDDDDDDEDDDDDINSEEEEEEPEPPRRGGKGGKPAAKPTPKPATKAAPLALAAAGAPAADCKQQ
ncbi:nucleosome assembly protein-domain-containing protein [Pavlovales sp. CCMP2436]|nr:nucleosome assembly protein-domain-containing protein [Pavlovales sp. CCMP2436]|mmetsp:Transcript_26374/g.60940  ORF Transcript_26374/g.60940 Transcript_26374/m.60940 type:complete len:467 (+) Transcript_26374:48-1448(+)